MTKIPGFLSALAFVGFMALMFFAATEGEDSASIVLTILIIFGAIIISSIGRPKPTGTAIAKSRKSVMVPVYIKDWMAFRWALLIGGGLLAGALQSHILWGLCIAGFIGITEYVSRRYFREDEENWEIVFHSEVDGYSNSDGDGDGD